MGPMGRTSAPRRPSLAAMRRTFVLLYALALSGLAVGVTDLDGATAASVAAEIGAAAGRATAVAADVTNLASLRDAVAAVEAALGPIGVLVNNAGWDRLHLFVETDPAFWD